MQKLMKNKWVIIGLAAVAIYIVVQNIVIPLLPKKKIVSEVIDMPGMENTTTNQTVTANHALKPTDIKQLFWNDMPQRNPFSSKLNNGSSEIQSLRESHQAMQQAESHQNAKPTDNAIDSKYTPINLDAIKPEPLPILSGLISGKLSKFAVINGKVVTEGDEISGYQVKKIMQQKVKLINITKNNRNRQSEITLALEKRS